MKNEQTMRILEGFDIQQFQQNLIYWFEQEQRELPWRQDQDPYKVWVSEIMLQQTRVDTVIPYFNHFMEKFPTPNALAEADEQDVLKAWEGLGYYSRARNLQTAVREVVESYDSKVPNNEKELGALKGVGPYTRGAILSIAYNIPSPAVDGNVMRVLSRILMIEEDIAKPATRKIFESIIRQTISEDNPSAFNQGLMELGAIVCTPKNPSCMLCPVQEHCRAFHEGMQKDLPIKTSQKKQKRIPYIVVLVQDGKGRYVVQKRPEDGLLANMWQFPMMPLHDYDRNKIQQWFHHEYGIDASFATTIDTLKHTFSHVIWDLEVVTGTANNGTLEREDAHFVTKEELQQLPFPVSHQKIMKHILS